MQQQGLIIYMFKIFSSQCDCSVDIGSSESFLRGGELPTLIVQSTGHAVHVFINGQLSGILFVPTWIAFLSEKIVILTCAVHRFCLWNKTVSEIHIYRKGESACWNKQNCTAECCCWIAG